MSVFGTFTSVAAFHESWARRRVSRRELCSCHEVERVGAIDLCGSLRHRYRMSLRQWLP